MTLKLFSKPKTAPAIGTSASGNKQWRIRCENAFTNKRVSGIVTGDIDRIVKGLACTGWITQIYYPAVHSTPTTRIK